MENIGKTPEQKIVKTMGIGSTAAVFMAYTCSVSIIPNGALVGEHATYMDGVLGVVLAIIIGSAIAASVSWLGYKTGVIKDVAWKAIFGRQGFRVCSLMFAFCQSFWACFDFFNAGQAIYNLLPEGSPFKNLAFCVGICIMLVLAIIGGIFGIVGVKWISTLTIPVTLIIFAVIFVLSFSKAGGTEALMNYMPAERTISIIGVVQIVLAMWMAGFVGMIDLTIQAKDTKTVVIAAVCGVTVVGLFMLVGQIGFIGTGMKTVGDISLSLGGAIFIVGNILVIFAQGNTVPACNYMYANSYSECLNLPKNPLAVIVPIIAAGLAFMIMYGTGVGFISNITNTVGAVMSPLVGVLLAEFYIVLKRKLEIKPAEEYPAIRPAAMISLAVGFVVSLAAVSFVTLSSVFTIIVAGLIHVVLRLVVKMN